MDKRATFAANYNHILSLSTLLLLFTIHAESVTCNIEHDVVRNYNIKENLLDNGWTRCYLKPYSDSLEIDTLISSCPTGTDYYLFVGAMATDDSVTIYTGAMAPSQVLTGYTGSTSVAYLPEPFATQNPGYNVYWYNYPKRSFGFAPTSSINIYSTNSIDRADRVSTNGDARLSWRVVGYGYIGGRAGTFWISNSNSIWHKAIYYKYCPPTTSPTPAPTELPTHYPSNDPTINPTNPTRHPTISPSNYPSAPPTVSPTMSPTIPPTTAPTNAPSASPSHAPTFSPYEMIVIQDSYICADLAESTDVIYNITLAE
eukprot:139451_1